MRFKNYNIIFAACILFGACDCEDNYSDQEDGSEKNNGGFDLGSELDLGAERDSGPCYEALGASCYDEDGSARIRPIDVLWVIDNSGSMCQEQRFLGDQFERFIEELAPAKQDIHIGVTTTHVPAAPHPTEPVAEAGHLQSQPQPIPTFDTQCRGNMANNFAPIRQALEVAQGCMRLPDAQLLEWTKEQIACAIRDTPGNSCEGVADRDGNGTISTEDLFPRADEYRALPRFLNTADYRGAGGQLDVARLKADFACVSLVGTRGTGYEKGLTAAILAVSPELTGAGEPNAGFIRAEADTAVIFVTDENDCSNDGAIAETGNACSADSCDYWNSPHLEAMSPLLKPQEFKAQFMAALSATKGAPADERAVVMAGIFGSWRPFEGQSYPVCDGLSRPEVPIACVDAVLGASTSGDRYQRAIRQFANYYPNDASKGDPLNFDKRDTGWMCQGDFSPALKAISQLIAINALVCKPALLPCTP